MNQDRITRIYVLLRKAGSVQWPLLTLTVLTAALRIAGVFSEKPHRFMEIIHSKQFCLLVSLLAVVVLCRLYCEIRERLQVPRFLVQLALLLFCSALLLSKYTHFEGKSVRFEGQGMNGLIGDYVQESVYKGKYGRLPSLGFHVNLLKPVTNSECTQLKQLSARITLSTSWSRTLRETTITSPFPLFTAWTFIRLTDFGYATRYSMSDAAGNLKNTEYRYLRLFPPGSEGHFVPYTYGYNIALRLYPDFVVRGTEPASRSPELTNPLFKVRIVRHKDIIYNEYMKIDEKLRFDSTIFSLHDAVKWAEFTLIKDAGIYAVAGGVLCLVLSCFLSLTSRTTSKHISER